MSESTQAVGAPLERHVRPALGYKHHAERVRNTGQHMETTAAFIETQNAEIEYLYAALQRVRNRVGGSRSNNATALDVLAIADAALKYEA